MDTTPVSCFCFLYKQITKNLAIEMVDFAALIVLLRQNYLQYSALKKELIFLLRLDFLTNVVAF